MSAIRAGYKQTEVGVIPEEWEDAVLADVAEIRVGRDLIEDRFSQDADSRFRFPVFSNTVSNSGLYGYYSTPEYEGDSLTVVGRGVGLGTAFVRTGGYGAIGRLLVLHPAHGRADARYLTDYINHRVTIFFETGGIPQLTGIQFAKYKVALPPLPEQRAIAETLSDADVLIESLEQLLTKKRHLKQAAMQELLTGKKRLPGFSGDWATTRLGDVADPNQKWSFTGGPFGSNLKSSDYTDGGVRIIQLQNIGDGQFHNDYSVFTSREKANELLSCNIYPGEIILSKMGDPVARACLIPSFHDRYLMCSDGIRLAVNPKRFNTYFVYLSINAPSFRVRAENAGTGSTRKRIGLTELRNLELSCPDLSEQTAIATILCDMDAEISDLEAQLAKSRTLKQGMMQKLLTGEIRLI